MERRQWRATPPNTERGIRGCERRFGLRADQPRGARAIDPARPRRPGRRGPQRRLRPGHPQWAARQLADRINDLGWQHGETAHDATNTPIPMLEPPRVAAVPSEKERPYWGWTTKELDTKAEQLRGFVARAGQLPELAHEIATKQLEADRLVAASATYAERGREWDQAAAELEALRTHHRASARNLSSQMRQ